MSRHGYFRRHGDSLWWEAANPNCFYGEDCETCNPNGVYDDDDDRKPPFEYTKGDV